MELTQQDFEERLARVDDGTADDEDQRLVRLYRNEGYVAGGEPVDGSWLAGQQAAVDDGYDNLEYRELQALARKRELNAGGSATDLLERLREQDAKLAAEQSAE
jgi:hypothetical protein